MLRIGPWRAWKLRLEGLGIYSANAWQGDPWDHLDAQGPNYSFVYPGNIGTRGYEALRQGIQEYKRLHRPREPGCEDAALDAWVSLVASGVDRVEVIDAVREAMDRKLVELSRE